MSTPSLESVRARRRAAAAVLRFNRALIRFRRDAEGAARELRTAGAYVTGDPENYAQEAVGIEAVLRMLWHLDRESHEVADLWRRVAEAEASSRGAAAYLDALKDDGSNEVEAREAELAAVQECLRDE